VFQFRYFSTITENMYYIIKKLRKNYNFIEKFYKNKKLNFS